MGSLKCVDVCDECDNTWLNETNNAEGKTMKAITAKEILSSETFFLVAVMDALKIVAQSNGRQMSDAVKAYSLRVPAVVEQVEKLVLDAASQMASDLNATVAS